MNAQLNPRTPVAEEIRILAGAGAWHLQDSSDVAGALECLEEIEALSSHLPPVEKLVQALQWAIDWIDDCSSMDTDTIDAVKAIKALLKEVGS